MADRNISDLEISTTAGRQTGGAVAEANAPTLDQPAERTPSIEALTGIVNGEC